MSDDYQCTILLGRVNDTLLCCFICSHELMPLTLQFYGGWVSDNLGNVFHRSAPGRATTENALLSIGGNWSLSEGGFLKKVEPYDWFWIPPNLSFSIPLRQTEVNSTKNYLEGIWSHLVAIFWSSVLPLHLLPARMWKTKKQIIDKHHEQMDQGVFRVKYCS